MVTTKPSHVSHTPRSRDLCLLPGYWQICAWNRGGLYHATICSTVWLQCSVRIDSLHPLAPWTSVWQDTIAQDGQDILSNGHSENLPGHLGPGKSLCTANQQKEGNLLGQALNNLDCMIYMTRPRIVSYHGSCGHVHHVATATSPIRTKPLPTKCSHHKYSHGQSTGQW